MILLDIINNIDDNLTSNTSSYSNNNIILKFVNKYENQNNNIINNIIDRPLLFNEIINIKCSICGFIGSGSYGKVYKIKIKNIYYALKISVNEEPKKFLKRYNSFIDAQDMERYVINIYIAGKINADKYIYYSIMEYGGKNLKSIIPIKKIDGLQSILRQLHNIIYLCSKHKLVLTDFKLNNIVVNNEYRLKLIDLYIDCNSYSPCKECKIVKTYSAIEIDKIKYILDDINYNQSYLYIPLAIGLIDLLCINSASSIFTNIANEFEINLGIKKIIPVIQIACYNYIHNSNNSIKKYNQVYNFKKKIEKKYPIIKDNLFYEKFLSILEVKDIYKKNISNIDFRTIIHNLISACPDDRTIYFFKNFLNKIK